MLAGYIRVSTAGQSLDLQRDALARVGCERVFEERTSGARFDRPLLAQALDHTRATDVAVWLAELEVG